MVALPFSATTEGLAIQNRQPFYPACEIAVPPSANRMWRHVRGISYPSKEYETWLGLAGPDLLDWFGPIKQFPVIVTITLLGGKGFMESGDLDNIVKPVGDVLQLRVIRGRTYGAGIIPNDDVRYICAGRQNYYTREEHFELFHPGEKATKAALAALTARCFVMIHPKGGDLRHG